MAKAGTLNLGLSAIVRGCEILAEKKRKRNIFVTLFFFEFKMFSYEFFLLQNLPNTSDFRFSLKSEHR